MAQQVSHSSTLHSPLRSSPLRAVRACGSHQHRVISRHWAELNWVEFECVSAEFELFINTKLEDRDSACPTARSHAWGELVDLHMGRPGYIVKWNCWMATHSFVCQLNEEQCVQSLAAQLNVELS